MTSPVITVPPTATVREMTVHQDLTYQPDDTRVTPVGEARMR